jgi:tol-pal system protein YbgF
MRSCLRLIVLALAACATAAPAAAQNRVESQLFLEIRTLQNQVQQLTAAINGIAEHLKQTDAQLGTQANALLKGFADQKVLIDALAVAQRTSNEREGEVSVRVLQLNQEMKAIREGLEMQQTLLNQILAQLPQAAGAAPAGAAGAEPAAPPAAQTPPRTGGDIPPSPSEYYSAAFNYFYKGQFDSAVETLTDAIKRFPDSPEAARAQLTIGDAYQAMGGHDEDALAAYGLVIKNYKDPEVLPDAYLKQGDTFVRLGQKESARKSYEDVRKLFPTSSAAIFAQAALKRMGIIK